MDPEEFKAEEARIKEESRVERVRVEVEEEELRARLEWYKGAHGGIEEESITEQDLLEWEEEEARAAQELGGGKAFPGTVDVATLLAARRYTGKTPRLEKPEPSPVRAATPSQEADLVGEELSGPPTFRDPMRKAIIVITGDPDEDEAWLEGRIGEVKTGVQAVLEIAWNWYEGRCLGRLHPDVQAWRYILDRVGPLGKSTVVPLLVNSNWSERQIAAVAAISPSTVHRQARNLPSERPPATIGRDGKLRRVPVPRVPILSSRSDPIERINPEHQRYALAIKRHIQKIDLLPVPVESEALAETRRALVEALIGTLEEWLAQGPGGIRP